jgi:hypothetical protein
LTWGFSTAPPTAGSSPDLITITLTDFAGIPIGGGVGEVRFSPIASSQALQHHNLRVEAITGAAASTMNIRITHPGNSNKIEFRVLQGSSNNQTSRIILQNLEINANWTIPQTKFGLLVTGNLISNNTVWTNNGTGTEVIRDSLLTVTQDRFTDRGVVITDYIVIGTEGDLRGPHSRLSFAWANGTMAATIGNDRENVNLSSPIINHQGTTYLPLRAIATLWNIGTEHIGSWIEYVPGIGSVRVAWVLIGERDIRFFVGFNIISINGVSRPMTDENGNPLAIGAFIPTPTETYGLTGAALQAAIDRTYVPLRPLMNAAGVSNARIDTTTTPGRVQVNY